MPIVFGPGVLARELPMNCLSSLLTASESRRSFLLNLRPEEPELMRKVSRSTVAKLRRIQFGRSSDQIDAQVVQFQLALEDPEVRSAAASTSRVKSGSFLASD